MIFGALLSLASSFSFSVNAILVRRGIAGAGGTASQGAFITVLLGVPFGFIAVVLTGQVLRFGEIAPMGYLLLLAAGVVHFGVGRYCNYRSVEAIGAARSGPIQGVVTPYSILMAVILLDEVVTLTMLFAIALVLLGPAVIIERRPRTPAAVRAQESGPGGPPAARNPLEIRLLEGYTFARTAAIGTFVAYSGAAAVLLATLVLPRRRALIGAINLRVMRLFGGAGLFVFLAQLLRFFALSLADVSVVNPLQRMANVFTVILTWMFNRSLETITLRVVIGVLVSFAGSALLVYSAATR